MQGVMVCADVWALWLAAKAIERRRGFGRRRRRLSGPTMGNDMSS